MLDIISWVLGKNLFKISSHDSASTHLKLLENIFMPKLNLKYFIHWERKTYFTQTTYYILDFEILFHNNYLFDFTVLLNIDTGIIFQNTYIGYKKDYL